LRSAQGMNISGPFENIESAHEYVSLLVEALEEASHTISQEMEAPSALVRSRHLDALRLIDYKLKTLERHLTMSRRLLTDLRTLRRYLLDERAIERDAAAPPYTTVRAQLES
jgi:hypothetical protein